MLWNVPIQMLRASPSPMTFPMRSFISRAALFVNVNDRIENGSTPCWMRFAMRYVSTRVFPDPAPAMTIMGPS